MAEKILSVFVDESGDFGPYDYHAPYYLVAMVLHDQTIDISGQLRSLTERLSFGDYPPHAIHVGPLIRREAYYANDYMESRKKLFNTLFQFVRVLDVHYICPIIRKDECPDTVAIASKLSRAIARELRNNQDYFGSFDKIILYYDNGQIELTKILVSVFTALFDNVEFRKVQPVDYRLFQVADLICSMELISKKVEANTLSKSEMEFFVNARDLKKNYLKPLMKKKI